jgi:2-oxoglutarate dehydrogenase E1 component
MNSASFATRYNADIIDEKYELWLSTPEELEPEWKSFFEGFELGQNSAPKDQSTNQTSGVGYNEVRAKKQAKVIGALYAYRSIGHTQADLDCLNFEQKMNPRLSLARLGFEVSDLEESFDTGNYLGGVSMKVGELLRRLQKTYSGTVGVEYLHIQETYKRRWLQSKMEPTLNQPNFSKEQKYKILNKIWEAELFEKFLHTRYVGQKRFSLEGGEALISALDAIIEKSESHKIEEYVIGMAHRGRLNVLANIMDKSYDFIFEEFSENYIPETAHGSGDVKYHLGYESDKKTSTGYPVHLHLSPNPSHLEAVDGVVQGKARARQRLRGDTERNKVIPILIHGDAAIAGQGIVAEVFNYSKLTGYKTGGTIHIVVNNHIGFTTDPSDSRSSLYCTDISKMIDAPIFHVNGRDALAVAMVSHLALEYRQEFGEDVVIDINCYRKHGHNEGDEPTFTQPTLYKRIAKTQSIGEQLSNDLIKSGELASEDAERLRVEFQNKLDSAFTRVKTSGAVHGTFHGSSGVFQPSYSFDPVDTTVSPLILKKVSDGLTKTPKTFNVNPKIKRLLAAKKKAFEGGDDIDWGFAESLSFGSLLLEGTPIRLSGQDSERGTFSQRHAVLYDMETRESYTPLRNIDPEQERFCVYNSSLSEAGILGFDYGYSVDYPRMLAIWEAQFGDFANGAQVIIDQFICSGESKWAMVSDLVMLLPHGFEGQGPEHSSARMERFLQLCAEDNMEVCNLTTPAQYFHILRRQMKRNFRKPLIIMTPKSLLRNKNATSTVKELQDGKFHEILDDAGANTKTKRVILCSGKVYYDLIEHRHANNIKDTAIIRVEQVAPFHEELMKKIFARYKMANKIVWCQEEPKNMGSWSYISPILMETLNHPIIYSGRKASASPATGSLARHKIEQKKLVEEAFTL